MSFKEIIIQGKNLKLERFWIVLKWLIVGFLLYGIFSILENRKEDIGFVSYHLKRVISVQNSFFFLGVFLMSFLNWGFEAKKWQILVSKVESISFHDAYKSVLMGLSFGFISQADLGDLAGKMVLIKSENRKKSTGAVLLGGGLQTYISLLFGTLSLVYFMINVFPKGLIFYQIILFLCFLGITIGIVLLYFRKNMDAFFNKVPFFTFIKPFLIVLKSYSNWEIFEVFALSCSRYLIFSLQFLIILLLFQIPLLIIDLSMIIFFVFFVKTIVPSISFISDLGVRGVTSLYLFEFYNISPSLVIASTFTIWVINILIPVLMGTLVLIFLKRTQFQR